MLMLMQLPDSLISDSLLRLKILPTRIVSDIGGKFFYFENAERQRYACLEHYYTGEIVALVSDQISNMVEAWEVPYEEKPLDKALKELFNFVTS